MISFVEASASGPGLVSTGSVGRDGLCLFRITPREVGVLVSAFAWRGVLLNPPTLSDADPLCELDELSGAAGKV